MGKKDAVIFSRRCKSDGVSGAPPLGRKAGMLVVSMTQSVTNDTELLAEALDLLEREFSGLPASAPQIPGESRMASVLAEAARRMGDNFPYFHPLYAGQMLKPPHPVARAAYAMVMWLNPNNHALDGGRASSRMEWEAVREIAAMFGWSPNSSAT